MKHSIFTGICLGLFFLSSGGLLGAFEVEISGGINYLTFDPELRDAYRSNISDESDPDYDSDLLEFKPYLYAFGDIILRNNINENMAFSVNLSRDNILHNSISGLLITKSEFFSYGFGPFIGIIEMPEDPFIEPFLGIEGELNFLYPGVVFVNLSGALTIKNEVEFFSEHNRSNLSAKIGVWLPSTIPSFTFSMKNFTRKIDDFFSVKDTLLRYQFSIEIFAQKEPVVFRIDAGYQAIERYYDHKSELIGKSNDFMDMIFIGFELKWHAIIIGAEVPVLFIPESDSYKPTKTPAFYRMPKFTLGLTHTIK